MTRLLLQGAAVLEGVLVPDALLACEDGLVTWAGPSNASPLSGWPQPQRLPDEHTLLPGLVDLHCHGGARFDFADAGTAIDPGAEGAALAVAYHRSNGTTSVIASIVSGSDAATRRAISALAPLVDDGLLAGLHLEGPYLSPGRAGAHDPAQLRPPDLAELEGWLDLADGRVVQMTLAPELPGAAAAAAMVRDAGAIASVGHTDADQQTVAGALSAAVADGRPALVTHLFNAMPPLHHRAPGPVGAALSAAGRGEAVLELIADGVHLDDALVATVVDLVGAGQVALVSDAMAAAGSGDGDYRLGGQQVRVSSGVARVVAPHAPTDAPPGAIAGGTSCLLDVVRRCVGPKTVGQSGTALPLPDVVAAASVTPTRVLRGRSGVEGGRRPTGPLTPGSPADLLVVDQRLRPVHVAVRGAWVTKATTAAQAGPQGAH